MNYIFYTSLLVTICFIISVAVAAATPDSGSNTQAYSTAYGIFFAVGLAANLFINFTLYPNKEALIDQVSNKLKQK